ncbi:MAG: hypothetical protein ABEN55_10945, partial [Bradymonadaceae bacterium]
MCGRVVGPVGQAWLIVAVVGAVMFAVFGATAAGRANAFSWFTLEGLGSTVAAQLAIGVTALVVASLLIGLIRPLRTVAFRGPEAVPDLSTAFGLATERFWMTAGVLVGWTFLWFGGMAVFAAMLIEGGQPASDTVMGLFALGVYPAILPVCYVVPATDLGIVDVVGTCVEVVFGHIGYLLVTAVGMLVGVAFLFCGLVIVSLFWPIGIVVTTGVVFGMWLLFATVFATVEETAGVFDPEID